MDEALGTEVAFIDTDPDRGGIQKNATTYFRKEVMVEKPSDFSNFAVRIRYDDGAAIYLNGVEVVRTDNLPADAAFDTFATSRSPSESTYFDFVVDSSSLIDGLNTLAVEIHNESAGSSDMRFDLVLSGEIDLSNGSNVTEPVEFNGPTQLNARSFDSSNNEWSAVTSTFFTLDTIPADETNFIVSEIHYRPAEPTIPAEIAVSTNRDDYEFIELLNTASQPIDLTGVSFAEGIDFHFADNTVIEADGRVVLVKDLDAFTARYGAMATGMVAGEYGGRLSNDGEQLVLRKAGNLVLQDFTYNDKSPWPILSDGAGYSMIYTGTDATMGTSWSPHALIGGGPGVPDAALPTGYDEWKLANNITDDNSDDDGDGLTAFAEYATGNDPAVPSPNPVSNVRVVKAEGDSFFSISYRQSLAATDVAFKIQESLDLQTWTDVTNPVVIDEITNDETQTSQVTIRLPDPVSGETRSFLRVLFVR